MSVRAGNTFLDTTANPHLWIVVAGPDVEGMVVWVNLTSAKGRNDRTTLCYPDEHPFIDRPTVVTYKYAECVDVARILAGLESGMFIRRENCSAELLGKIANGLLRSDSTPIGVANAYVDMLRANQKP